MANSVDQDQTAHIGAVCSGSTLFTSILTSSVMLGNYLQQTTSADNIFRCICFLGAFRVNEKQLLERTQSMKCVQFFTIFVVLRANRPTCIMLMQLDLTGGYYKHVVSQFLKELIACWQHV